MPNAGFDAGSLERRYAFIDDCPPHLLQAVVTLPIGALNERVIGVRKWQEALLRGETPARGTWPKAPIDVPARHALTTLGLSRFCKNQPELVDAVMRDVLAAFARSSVEISVEVSDRLKGLEHLERLRLMKIESAGAERENRASRNIELDEDLLRQLRETAEREVRGRERAGDRALLAAWGERARAWSDIAGVFGDLGQLLGRGWDLSLGVLKHVGWLEVVRLSELIGKLPQLREIVRSLGRLHASEQTPTVAETIFQNVRRLEEDRREVETPLVPAETRGVERGAEIARMLPVEATNLGHRKLRYLWHARRAERALLIYRVEGVEIERVLEERDAQVAVESKSRRPERGPIISVVDTSGSMHGLPEQVAKAIVLEALRTAHSERRRCLVYAYSGPGHVMESELDLTVEGIGRLLAFLGFSFGGGNDEAGVMTTVLERLRENDWRKADVVFVSDGEWPAPQSLIAAARQATDSGTRLHGVQIGNRGRTGLHTICDPVHEFRDWAAAGGWRHHG